MKRRARAHCTSSTGRRWARGVRPPGLLRAADPSLEPAVPALGDEKIERWSGSWSAAQEHPGRSRRTLVHGDYRPGNMIVHPGEPRVVAVLDWNSHARPSMAASPTTACRSLGNEWEGLRDARWPSWASTEADYLPRTAGAPGAPARALGFYIRSTGSAGRDRAGIMGRVRRRHRQRSNARSARARAFRCRSRLASRGVAPGLSGGCAPGRSGHLDRPAGAMPPPMHIVDTTLARSAALALDERVADHGARRSCRTMADGMAPLEFSFSIGSRACRGSDHLHGERPFSSQRSIWSHLMPVRSSRRGTAKTGPDPHLVPRRRERETTKNSERVQPRRSASFRVHDHQARRRPRAGWRCRGDVALLAGDRLERREASRSVGPVALVLLSRASSIRVSAVGTCSTIGIRDGPARLLRATRTRTTSRARAK